MNKPFYPAEGRCPSCGNTWDLLRPIKTAAAESDPPVWTYFCPKCEVEIPETRPSEVWHDEP